MKNKPFHLKSSDWNNRSKILNRFNQKIPLIYMMSGGFPYRMNLIHLTQPKGLHRQTYFLKGDLCGEHQWVECYNRISDNAHYYMCR